MTTNLKEHIPQYQSFMTAPEWKNVEISEDLANFLESGKPLQNFVFLKEAFDTNRIFYHTLNAAHQYNS